MPGDISTPRAMPNTPRAKDGKRIPIAAAKHIAQEYGYDQVVIFARAPGIGGKEHVTTYGTTTQHCAIAAAMGNKLKRFVGWPEEKCQDKPARVRRRGMGP